MWGGSRIRNFNPSRNAKSRIIFWYFFTYPFPNLCSLSSHFITTNLRIFLSLSLVPSCLWPAYGSPAPVDVFPHCRQEKVSLAFSGMCFVTWKTLGIFGVTNRILCDPVQPAKIRNKLLFSTTHCSLLKAYCAIWVRRSNFRHQASPRVSPHESTQRRKVELWARNVR